MSRLFDSFKLFNVLKIPVRYKNPDHHWSVVRKRKPASQKALDHFDDFYKSVYGESWKHIRSALLSDDHKYVAVINNFSDSKEICERLESLGAMNMKEVYIAGKKNIAYQKELKKNEEFKKKVEKIDKKLDQIITEKLHNYDMYPDGKPSLLIDTEKPSKEYEFNSFAPAKLQSIETKLNVAKDNSRIIKASLGVSASQLFEYIPTTKIKGMEDYELESKYYSYYEQGADFFTRIEKEYEINFPDKLLLYTFEEGNNTKFPRPKMGLTEVLDYFVLDGASVLPILSLDLKPGDTLLDMCAAPGGKTLIAFQSLVAGLIVANDIQESRINKLNDFIDEIIPDVVDWGKNFFITQNDARNIEDKGIYNKILVDVPCTTDRHVLNENNNNIFKNTRIKERLRLPELQSAILTNALKLVVPGGTVVYSTCSLSPIQNDGVVQMALKQSFEESNHLFVVKDQSPSLEPLKYLYNFGNYGLKYGHIVIPSKSRNWGPMYFCKMVRIQ